MLLVATINGLACLAEVKLITVSALDLIHTTVLLFWDLVLSVAKQAAEVRCWLVYQLQAIVVCGALQVTIDKGVILDYEQFFILLFLVKHRRELVSVVLSCHSLDDICDVRLTISYDICCLNLKFRPRF